MEVHKIMRTFLTLPCLRGVLELHLVLVMLSLFCLLPCLLGVLEFAPSVSNVLIILSTSMSSKIMGTLLTLGKNSSTPRRHGSGENNEYITNTRGKMSSWSARVCT
jgi:hypothetical protein